MSRRCTMGRPASIMVANCRVKTTISFSLTPPPKGSLSSMSLAFFLALDMVMPCARRRLATSGSASASMVPLRVSPARVRPSQAKTGIYRILLAPALGPLLTGRRGLSARGDHVLELLGVGAVFDGGLHGDGALGVMR